MEELNTPIFAQAKVEYTKQLIEILYPHMFDGVKSIYDEELYSINEAAYHFSSNCHLFFRILFRFATYIF